MRGIFAALLAVVSISAFAQGAPTVNENTGDLAYTYAFKLPKARGGYQPQLALVYSSANNQDLGYGHGWTLTSSYIELDTRARPDRPLLWLVHGTDRKLLVQYGSVYRPEVEDAFLEVTKATGPYGAIYTAVDASGTTYTFDRAFNRRAYLRRVADLLGNVVEYEYDPYKPDPTKIKYNNYPAGSTAPSFATNVVLTYVADSSLSKMAIGGFLVDLALSGRLSELLIEGGEGAGTRRTVRSYKIDYVSGGPVATTSVARVTEYGGAFVKPLPPTEFQYDYSSYGLGPGTYMPLPSLAEPYATEGLKWYDLDADGKLDLVGGSRADLYWARNSTPAGASTPTFNAMAPVNALTRPTLRGSPRPSDVQLVDFDGDGRLDLVQAWLSYNFELYQTVYRNLPGAFGEPVYFDVAGFDLYVGHVYAYATWPMVYASHGALIDLNGDGVLDYARKVPGECGPDVDPALPWCQWEYGLTVLDPVTGVYRVDKQPYTTWLVPGGRWFATSSPSSGGSFPGLDMNGDGLADGVWVEGSSVSTPYFGSVATTTGMWKAALNQGMAVDGTGLIVRNVKPQPTLPPERELWGNDPSLSGFADSPSIVVSSNNGEPKCGTRTFEDTRYVIADLLDLNGDNRPDLYKNTGVRWNNGRAFTGTSGVANGPQYPRYGEGFAVEPEQWPAGTCDSTGLTFRDCECSASVPSTFMGQFGDLNGDAIPDFVGVEIGPSRQLYFQIGVNGLGVQRPIVLRRVTLPEGAQYRIDYVPASMFSVPATRQKPVVSALRVEGTYVQPNTTNYWYGGSSSGSPWYDPIEQEDRGFSRSWSQDEVSKIVRATTWETMRHALIGRPLQIDAATGPLGTPATLSAPGVRPSGYTVFASQQFQYELRPISAGAGSCMVLSAGADAPGTAYPLRIVPSVAEERSIEGARQGSTRTVIGCADVDAYGTVLKATTTPSIDGYAGAALVTRQVLTGTTSCKNVPAQLRTTKETSAGTVLEEEYKLFDASCRLVEQYAPGSSTAKTNRTTFVYAAPFGQLSSSTTGGVTKGVTYDPTFALYVTEERSEDTRTALLTTYTYDLPTGFRLSAVGPKVVKANGAVPTSSPAPIARYYLYDLFGRTLAVGKQDFTTDAAQAWTAAFVPRATQVNQAVEAHQYCDLASPPAVHDFRFGSTKSFSTANLYTCGAAANPTLHLDDVAKVVTYRDGLGRPIQVRERSCWSASGSRPPPRVRDPHSTRPRTSTEPIEPRRPTRGASSPPGRTTGPTPRTATPTPPAAD